MLNHRFCTLVVLFILWMSDFLEIHPRLKTLQNIGIYNTTDDLFIAPLYISYFAQAILLKSNQQVIEKMVSNAAKFIEKKVSNAAKFLIKNF